MEARANARFVRMSPRKVRVIADLVRGMDVSAALDILKFTNRAAALPVRKLVESAVANAKQASSAVDESSMFIKTLTVDMGPRANMKRWRPRAMGRATRIVKGMSHISVVLGIR
ncbi:MAG: 50S ribosomal protein L22 [Myxococcota bacterium]|jgi:large subunit ribosomal protein L22|nr:50S ribosomal protein L22 [Myxococcota bacterium]